MKLLFFTLWEENRKTASFCILISCISLDVEATEAPAFDVVLKADKKRLDLLEEVCYFFIMLYIYLIKHPRCLVNVWTLMVGTFRSGCLLDV